MCSNWLGHRIASDKGASWNAARDDEDEDWRDTLAGRGYMNPDEVARHVERAKLEWARDATQESTAPAPSLKNTEHPPAKRRAASPVAPAVAQEVLELRVARDELRLELDHVGRVAEELRRALAAKGDVRPNTWSASAAALSDDQLRIKVVSRQVHLEYYDEDDDMDVEDPAVTRRRRYKSAMARGRQWVHRTTSTSSHSRSPDPSGKGKGRAAPPLEERISAWGEQGEPAHPTTPAAEAALTEAHTETGRHMSIPPAQDNSEALSLSSRISNPTPLAQRIDLKLPERPPTILPHRVPGATEWQPPSADEILQNYYHESREDGSPVPLTERQPGKYRIVHGRLIDLSKDFPELPPIRGQLNPFSGQPWTAQEVLLFPRGYPNWPARGLEKITEAERLGFPRGTGSLAGGQYDAKINGNRPRHERDPHLIRDMDRSRRLLPADMIETGGAWGPPLSVEDVQTLRKVARSACNLMAWDHWTAVVAWAGRTPMDRRTEIQREVLRQPMARPLWAPWIQPRTTHGSKAYKRDRQFRKAHRQPRYPTAGPAQLEANALPSSSAPIATNWASNSRAEDVGRWEVEDGEWGEEVTEGPTPDLYM
ncbi:hypothetical protein BDW22DRAFT_1433713 [Trametopsis cervina]|nr:hypothetical protein BDW22DRAFT_1433713 [Trametopsis cervina]